MTFRQDYFTQLTYLKEVLGDKLIKSQVIYDGSQEKSQSTNGIINFRNIGGGRNRIVTSFSIYRY